MYHACQWYVCRKLIHSAPKLYSWCVIFNKNVLKIYDTKIAKITAFFRRGGGIDMKVRIIWSTLCSPYTDKNHEKNTEKNSPTFSKWEYFRQFWQKDIHILRKLGKFFCLFLTIFSRFFSVHPLTHSYKTHSYQPLSILHTLIYSYIAMTGLKIAHKSLVVLVVDTSESGIGRVS